MSCAESTLNTNDTESNLTSSLLTEQFVHNSGKYHNELIEKWYEHFNFVEPNDIYKENVVENLLTDLSILLFHLDIESFELSGNSFKSIESSINEMNQVLINYFDHDSENVSLQTFFNKILDFHSSSYFENELIKVIDHIELDNLEFMSFINNDFGSSLIKEEDILISGLFKSISNSSRELWFGDENKDACDENNVIAFDAAGGALGAAICLGSPICAIIGAALASMIYRVYHSCHQR